MPFKKGQGGRPKGARNQQTRDVRLLCRELVESQEYRDYFDHRFKVGQCPPQLEAMIWHYAYGKPPEHIEHSGEIRLPTTVIHKHVPAER